MSRRKEKSYRRRGGGEKDERMRDGGRGRVRGERKKRKEEKIGLRRKEGVFVCVCVGEG